MDSRVIDSLKKLPNQPYWYEKSDIRPELTENLIADVVIVGAGYTGLWTAYYLLKKSPNLNIVILEKEHAGFGASGRNGGWASSIFPVSLSKVEKDFSREAAITLQKTMNDSVDEIYRVLEAEGIDADYKKEGYISVARTPAQLIRAQAAVDETNQLGLTDQWTFMRADESTQKINMSQTLGAIFTPHCAVIHPGKLVRGLVKLVEKMGAKIFENTAVTELSHKKVSTQHYTVQAETVVRATESYSCQLPGYKRSTIPLYSLAVATEPLSEALRNELNLHHRTAFNDMRHLLVYAQMTADHRLVVGGRGAPYHFGSRIEPQYDLVDTVHEKIYQTIVDFFPALNNLNITHRWGGALAVARDWYPSAGISQDGSMAWAGQYTGDGVAMSNLSGRILSSLILKIKDPITELPFVNKPSKLWEPEPFRWVGVNLGLTMMGLGDREEKITKMPSKTVSLLEKLTGAQ